MNLAAFFDAIRPMLAEQASAAATARMLYGEGPSEDADRLHIYQSMCRWRRADTLAGVFPRVHAVVLGLRDQRTWSALCTAYYARAPWTAIQALGNAAGFPAELARVREAHGLPAWLPELADFEWWAAATRGARDEDTATDGPLRLAPTAELRLYTHDLVPWVQDIDTIRPEPPAAGQFVVLFWRDANLIPCVRSVTTAEIRMLGEVQRGELPGERETARALHRIGALVGAAPWLDGGA